MHAINKIKNRAYINSTRASNRNQFLVSEEYIFQFLKNPFRTSTWYWTSKANSQMHVSKQFYVFQAFICIKNDTIFVNFKTIPSYRQFPKYYIIPKDRYSVICLIIVTYTVKSCGLAEKVQRVFCFSYWYYFLFFLIIHIQYLDVPKTMFLKNRI